MTTAEMTARIARGDGFIAALDQSGGSTPKALRSYGIGDDEWSGEDEMFALIHATSPGRRLHWIEYRPGTMWSHPTLPQRVEEKCR